MKRRPWVVAAFLACYIALASSPAPALDEPDRLWLVGEHAFADGLYTLAARTLERLVETYPSDRRLPEASVLLGKVRLAQGDEEGALTAFRRVQTAAPAGAPRLEAKFWEGEALFRLKRFGEARTAYDEVLRTDSTSPRAPDALYGYAWSELELKRPEPAVTAFRDFVSTWPDHALAPSATFYLARSLVDLKRYQEAVPLLGEFVRKHPEHKLAVEAQYLLGLARVRAGETSAGLADLRAFVAAHPSHDLAPAARRLVSDTVVKKGGRAELESMYKSLVAQKPATPEALSDAAAIAGRLGRTKDQEATLRRLRSEFPQHAFGQRAALDLAHTAFKRKEWKDAAASARVATRSQDEATRSEAWLLTGEAELKLKHFPAALKAFDAVGDVKGVDPSVRYRALAGAGLAHEEQREWRAALAAYEAVAGQSHDTTLRDWARQRVSAIKPRAAGSGGASPPAKKTEPRKGKGGP